MGSEQLPSWVQIIQAFGPTTVALVVGLIAAYVAWRQLKTASDKLRLDLFDRRYQYFLVTRKFLATIYSKGDLDYAALAEFDREIDGHEFIFDQEVSSYIERIRISALNLRQHNEEWKSLPVGEERTKAVKERRREFESLLKEHKLMIPIFSKTMKFG